MKLYHGRRMQGLTRLRPGTLVTRSFETAAFLARGAEGLGVPRVYEVMALGENLFLTFVGDERQALFERAEITRTFAVGQENTCGLAV